MITDEDREWIVSYIASRTFLRGIERESIKEIRARIEFAIQQIQIEQAKRVKRIDLIQAAAAQQAERDFDDWKNAQSRVSSPDTKDES